MKRQRRGDLSYRERVEISVYIGEGLSNNEIGRRIGRDPSTISREIKRNKGGPKRGQYGADLANDLAKYKRSLAASSNPRKKPEIWEYVRSKIKEGWSPGQAFTYPQSSIHR